MSKPISRVEAGVAPGLRHADHAAGGTGQDGVLALKQFGGGEAAGGHHEHEARYDLVRRAPAPMSSVTCAT